MARFFTTKDTEWAKVNMDANVLDTYKTDVIWLFGLDLSPLYSINRDGFDSLKEFPLPRANIKDIFKEERLRHFFVNTKIGLLEVRGATVHPGSDPERKTLPRGYFLTARLWGKEYVADLEELIGGSIQISNTKLAIPSPEALLKANSIVFSRQLSGWKGNVEDYIYINILSEQLQGYKLLSRNAVVIFIIFLIAVIIFITLFITTSVNLPLAIISQSLKKENPEKLRGLEKETSEFGDIARLITSFFWQRQVLLKEVAERKKAEARFQQVAEATEEWIWEVNKDGLYTYSSPVVEKILGYNPEEIIGKKYFYDFLTPDVKESLKKNALEVFTAKKPFRNFLNPNLHKNGNIIFLETSGSPMLDKEGNLLGYRGADTDITERKKAEDELKKAYTDLKETQGQLIQAEKLNAVGQLASGVAHEVRNPLGIILQGINYLEKKIPPDKGSETAEIMAMLKGSVQRADKIINALLDFSRAANSDLKLEDINSILESSLNLVKARFKFDNIDVVTETKEGLPMVLADKNKLEQVFINVLLNAAQAMPGGGKIIIRSYAKELKETKDGIGKREEDHFRIGEKAVIVEIEDFGSGISEENLKKIFDPFFTTKGPGSGVGLGLSVTRNIIHMHRGLIYAESQLGKGTKVIIILKISAR
ncbi:MAG: PAS domain S-box protein [Candidatus Omnitrophica bacterium]|nr:PAS domain S-box protein [Candidatus Omnitrophota bacterium]